MTESDRGVAVFDINGTVLQAVVDPAAADPLRIRSHPRPYEVTVQSSEDPGTAIGTMIRAHPGALLLIDRWVHDRLFHHGRTTQGVPTHLVTASEQAKVIGTVLEIVDFLERHAASKTTMLFVVGGGILQDVGAFAAALYKRGVPWTFVPTTLLAQGDSCVGGKTALNHRETKNLLALFAAPRRVCIETGFLRTLSEADWLSGAGEILRLCITGGERPLRILERDVRALRQRDLEVTTRLIRLALAIKQAVVEQDEFELDIRRSMNFGHSIGHALEPLTAYQLPHGSAVALGILVENEIAYHRGGLARADRDRIVRLVRQLIAPDALARFEAVDLSGILPLLTRDKKTEGGILKFAALEQIGRIAFLPLTLDATGAAEIQRAVASVLDALRQAT